MNKKREAAEFRKIGKKYISAADSLIDILLYNRLFFDKIKENKSRINSD